MKKKIADSTAFSDEYTTSDDTFVEFHARLET